MLRSTFRLIQYILNGILTVEKVPNKSPRAQAEFEPWFSMPLPAEFQRFLPCGDVVWQKACYYIYVILKKLKVLQFLMIWWQHINVKSIPTNQCWKSWNLHWTYLIGFITNWDCTQHAHEIKENSHPILVIQLPKHHVY